MIYYMLYYYRTQISFKGYVNGGSMYTALYRKFRPSTFSEVKGQEQIVTVLRNQVKYSKIGHAYLFSGTRGSGKTSVAKIFARAVNCENPKDGNPCMECETCKRIKEERSMDVIEIDAATNNGVDNMREVIEEVKYSPSDSKYKVYIIDEVHMLSSGAFNALLKTLEEPPEYAIFILATTEPHKVLATIKSRCQKYEFKRIKSEIIRERLGEIMKAEEKNYEENALNLIARKADGSMRDALSLLDQCISFCLETELTYDKVLEVLGAVDIDTFNKLYIAIKRNDVATCMDIAEEVFSRGIDIAQFILDFTWYFRNLLLFKVSDDVTRIEVSTNKLEEMKEVSSIGDMNELLRYIRIFSELSANIKYSLSKRAEFEIALIKLCKPEMEEDLGSIISRLSKIEKMIENGELIGKTEKRENTLKKSEEKPEKIEKATKPKKPKVDAPEEIKKIISSFKKLINSPKIRKPLDIVLNDTRPIYEEGNVLIFEVNTAFDKTMLEREDYVELIHSIILEKTGADISIKVRMANNDKKEKVIEGVERVENSLLTYTD